MPIFQLSGMGDAALEANVREAVARSNYSKKELLDIHKPVRYSMLNFVFDLSQLLQRLSLWQQMAQLSPDVVIPPKRLSIKSLLKRVCAKSFRWYVVPLAASQSHFNYETSKLISDLMSVLQAQNESIEWLYKEVTELREKYV